MENYRQNDDGMRYNLVTSFYCIECNSKLRLSYKKAKKDTSLYNSEIYKDDITGASKVDANIYIYPCEQCFGKLAKPLEELKKALDNI